MSEVDDYLSEAPEPQRSTLRALRATLGDLLPEAAEGLSYGVPALRVDGFPVAGYAYAKNHCSFFPHSGAVLGQVDPSLLEGYDWSKGTLRFPIDAAPDETLLRRLIEIRLAELES